jgi:hypothetical protein
MGSSGQWDHRMDFPTVGVFISYKGRQLSSTPDVSIRIVARKAISARPSGVGYLNNPGLPLEAGRYPVVLEYRADRIPGRIPGAR